MKCLLLLLVTCVLCVTSITDPKQKEHDRVHEKVPLSHKQHYSDEEEEHDHDPNYDHEAFLGEEEAHEYDELSPEESKEKLMAIVDKIDTNSDSYVSPLELKQWIDNVQKRSNIKDVEKLWEDLAPSGGEITWEHYVEKTYGKDVSDANTKPLVAMDKNRWLAADTNKDGKLNKEEFTHFEHPEETEHMKDIVIQETMEAIDKDKDGFISLEEFLADNHEADDSPASKEAVTKKFKNMLDLNKDNKLDRDEVRRWEFPDGYKHVIEDEVAHIFREVDANKDGKLSKDEIDSKYDIFVASKATNYGDSLTHDEM